MYFQHSMLIPQMGLRRESTSPVSGQYGTVCWRTLAQGVGRRIGARQSAVPRVVATPPYPGHVHRKKELNHPLVGRLVLQPTTFQVTDAPDLRMVVYTPLAEANTAKKLAQLVESMEVQMAE